MLSADTPTKIGTPWATGAGSGFVREVPDASQIGLTLGAASYTDGFPPATFTPVASGGSWPFGQDFNGALRRITQWLRWSQAGGVIKYDGTFQTAIGGYPLGARVESTVTPGLVWRSLVDGNTTNPDASGAGWSVVAFPDPGTAGLIVQSTTTNGANLRFVGNGAITPNKTIRVTGGRFQVANSAYTAILQDMDDAGNVLFSGTNTASGGHVGGFDAGGFQFRAIGGTYGAGLRNDGTSALLLSTPSGAPSGGWSAFRPFSWNLATGGVTIDGSGVGTVLGGNVAAVGSLAAGAAGISTSGAISAGAGGVGTTGNVAAAGAVSGASVSATGAVTAGTAGISTTGGVTASGAVSGLTVATSNGNVTANNGYLRAAFGSRDNLSDQNVAVLAKDFAVVTNSAGTYMVLPNNYIFQFGLISLPSDGNTYTFNFPVAFTAGITAMTASWGAANPTGSVGIQPFSTSQYIARNANTSGGSNGAYWIAFGR